MGTVICRRGWSYRGQRTVTPMPLALPTPVRYSIIPLLDWDEVVDVAIVEGTTNAETYRHFIASVVVSDTQIMCWPDPKSYLYTNEDTSIPTMQLSVMRLQIHKARQPAGTKGGTEQAQCACTRQCSRSPHLSWGNATQNVAEKSRCCNRVPPTILARVQPNKTLHALRTCW